MSGCEHKMFCSRGKHLGKVKPTSTTEDSTILSNSMLQRVHVKSSATSVLAIACGDLFGTLVRQRPGCDPPQQDMPTAGHRPAHNAPTAHAMGTDSAHGRPIPPPTRVPRPFGGPAGEGAAAFHWLRLVARD